MCGLPLLPLYGETFDDLLIPADAIQGFDTLVVDLQDVGARCYTYFSHLALLMKQLSGLSKAVVVLDRPNPIRGDRVEGPPLRAGWESFVGMLPIPMRHGLTIGEAAQVVAGLWGPDLDLKVIPMEGWDRAMGFQDTGLDWFPPSPNIPTPLTALVYPGTVFLEATNVSEGRGTTRPFELFGAPFVGDPEALARDLNGLGLPGVHFRPLRFMPRFDKFEGQTCGGCWVHVTDPQIFRPVLTGLAVVGVMRDRYPEFRFLDRAYEFDDRGAARLLAGDETVFDFLLGRLELSQLKAYFVHEEADFMQWRRDFLIYEG
jgi:uncharacterized protein YbbC (DUF1343 family)